MNRHLSSIVLAVACCAAVRMAAAPAAPAASTAPAASAAKQGESRKTYTLVPGDRINVAVTGQESDLNRTVTVQPNGTVKLKYIEDVKIGGLTIDQAEQEIE